MSWELVSGCGGSPPLPILLKGVLHPEDARLAVEHGVDGVLVSNHGGRQLDGALATLDALPAVVEAVDGRLPVLLDGGVRRGADVLVGAGARRDARCWSAGRCSGGWRWPGRPVCGTCSTCCAPTWTGRWRWPASPGRVT